MKYKKVNEYQSNQVIDELGTFYVICINLNRFKHFSVSIKIRIDIILM